MSRYDPAVDAWSPIASMGGYGRSGHATTVFDGLLYAIGGYGHMKYPQDGERYDPSTDAWSPMASSMGTARRYHTAAVVDGLLYVIGGCHWNYDDDQTWLMMRSGERYDPATHAWSLYHGIWRACVYTEALFSYPVDCMSTNFGLTRATIVVGACSSTCRSSRCTAGTSVADGACHSVRPWAQGEPPSRFLNTLPKLFVDSALRAQVRLHPREPATLYSCSRRGPIYAERAYWN